MKIMMLLIGHDFPPDIRVEKETRALLAAGHQVIVVCENRNDRPRKEQLDGVQILRLPRDPSWVRQVNRAQLFVLLHSPRWERAITEIVQMEQPEALHVHDLAFVGPGLRIARKSGLPLVADLHENYPALLQIRYSEKKRNPVDRFIFNPKRFARYESRVLPRCDNVIVVVEEAASRVRDLGVRADKIVIVGNTADIDAADRLSEQVLELPGSEMKFLYVGGFGTHRGLDVVIKAMPRILRQIPSALFVVVGDGDDRSSLEQLAQDLGIAHNVRFEGKQPFSSIYTYIAQCDVCLVPHVANPHTNSTMPHKLFQYMHLKKPVIVSNAIPLARVVRETEAGLIFESGNPDSFAQCVFKLQAPELRRRLGQNGYRSVAATYNWRIDAQRLVELYATLSAPRLQAKRGAGT
jgi:glycosyltransferase involved in cell wall biosynthesis